MLSLLTLFRKGDKSRPIEETNYGLGWYERIYHYHVRKSGGTSINVGMLASLKKDSTCPQEIYEDLAQTKGHRLIIDGYPVVGWSKKAIEKGDYYYGFSHIPCHKLKLPKKTFTLTCLRDPVERVISHYQMLVRFHEERIDHPCMRTEWPWAKNGIIEFVRRMPREHLCRQLYMFSADFSIDEAYERILGCHVVMFTGNLSEGIKELARRLGNRDLKVRHEKKALKSSPISKQTRKYLKSYLEDEILLYERISAYHKESR